MSGSDEPVDGGPKRGLAFTFGLERLGLVALAAPVLAGLAVMAVSLAAVFGFLRLQVDDSLSELFRTNTPEFRQYEEIDRRFPSSEYDILVVIEGPDLLKKPGLEALSRTIIDLQLTDGVKGLVSMLSANPITMTSGVMTLRNRFILKPSQPRRPSDQATAMTGGTAATSIRDRRRKKASAMAAPNSRPRPL